MRVLEISLYNLFFLGLASTLILCRNLCHVKYKQLKLVVTSSWAVMGHNALATQRLSLDKASGKG